MKSKGCLLFLVVALLGISTTGYTQTPLVNLVQWTEGKGGNGHWYAIIPAAQYWDDARLDAMALYVEGQPGYLATITSAEENNFVLNTVMAGLDNPCTYDACWLGGYDASYLAWEWNTGEVWDYLNWADGEPNNQGIETALVVLGPGVDPYHGDPGQWNNSLSNDDVNPHALFWSVVEFGEHEDHIAEPPDSLVNLVQWEQAEGGNGHWYGVVTLEQYWDDARLFVSGLAVEDQVGYVATVTSVEENEFILGTVMSGTSNPSVYDGMWLGGIGAGDGGWGWITNESWDYTNWAVGEPNNVGIETALMMLGPTVDPYHGVPGEWNNALNNADVNPLSRFWTIVEFGGASDPGPETLINLVQWPAGEGGNDHWYGIMPIEKFWDDARTLATTYMVDDQPGYLATITSESENDFIAGTVAAGIENHSIYDGLWLGGEDTSGAFDFGWISDETWVYANWAEGEPNNEGFETAVLMLGPAIAGMGYPGQFNNALPNGDIHDLHRFWSVIEFGGYADKAQACCVVRGDIDHSDGQISIADLIFMVSYMFQDGQMPPCSDGRSGYFPEADVNADGSDMNVADLVYLVSFMFSNGPAPLECE